MAPSFISKASSMLSERPPSLTRQPSVARVAGYSGRVTPSVVLGAVLGAFSGLFMGFENGIAGGVASFPEFQAKFFPSILQAHAGASGSAGSAYCKYDDQLLALFVSCVYLASSAGAIVGSFTTPRWGRRATIGAGAVCFLIGAALQGFAVHVSMLILGRIALGLGIGMNDQAGPQFLSEIAPYRLRAAFNCCFQLLVVVGILVAQLINYGTHTLGDLGWRLSLGLAAAPAVVVLALSLVLDDTPNSLVERGHADEGLRVLRKIRGTHDVSAEFQDIQDAAKMATGNQWRLLLTQRQYRPQLILNVCISVFQMLTGINAIVFFSTPIFESVNAGDQGSALLSTVIVGVVFVAATFIAIGLCDRLGRRPLFQSSGLVQLACMAGVGGLLATYMDPDTGGVRNLHAGRAILTLICLYTAAFGWGWGPLAWLAPSELTPLEARAAGTALAVVSNHIVCFFVGQFFLSMMCKLQWGAFVFFAAWLLVMTVFIQLLLPESKGVPIEEIQEQLFSQHWVWHRFVPAHGAAYSGAGAGSGGAAPPSFSDVKAV